MRRTVAGMLLGLMAASALAQQQEGGRTTAAVPSMPAVTDPVTAGASVAATTLPTVDAVRPDLAPLDPFAPRPNAMARRWRYDPSPEEIALRHHGYIHYYGNLALAAGLRGLNRVTGGREQIQAATARDVPLDDEQIARAARWSEAAAADR